MFVYGLDRMVKNTLGYSSHQWLISSVHKPKIITVKRAYLWLWVVWSEKQEVKLSQRDRATLRVIEYFAKSLEVIRNDNVEYDQGFEKPMFFKESF